MDGEPPRSRRARAAAEQALVRVVHHYGGRPEFVLLGGLVPELLCSTSEFTHAGTTDVDVQVNLEIVCGAVNTSRLEHALRNAGFEPENERVWRWKGEMPSNMVVKFELLADLDTEPAESMIRFNQCDDLGAVNLRGTGFAAKDVVVRDLTAKIGGVIHNVQVNVTGLAGYLLAKTAAAHSRRKPKDWYDLAFVLLQNDAGGPAAAARAVKERFDGQLTGPIRTALDDLLANFFASGSQGPTAYADQMLLDHPDLDRMTVASDAIVAVREFHRMLFDPTPQ